jgi:hypothetical protein
MEDAGGDLGRAEEESRIPQMEAGKVGSGAVELDRPEIVAADATTDAGVTAESGLARTEGAVTAEVIMSRPATNEATIGETAAVEASSGPASQGDPREVTREVVKEVSASMRVSELPEVVT